MSRPLRIDFPNSWHHVMNRGARKDPIFESSGDAYKFLDLVAEASDRYGIEAHAYCLMTNHYHLLLRSVDGTLSRAMRHIDGVYAQNYNWRHGHDGPLFRGRFRSLLVDSDRYLAAVATYIHRNPLEARMVDNLADHRWSSYPSYLELRRPEKWLVTSVIRSVLPSGPDLRQMTERRALPEEVETFYARPALGPILGGEEFRIEAQHRVDSARETEPQRNRISSQLSIDRVINVVALEFEISQEVIRQSSPGRRNVARSVAISVASNAIGLPLGEVAQHFGLAGSPGVAAARRLVHQLSQEDNELVATIGRIAAAIGSDAKPLPIET